MVGIDAGQAIAALPQHHEPDWWAQRRGAAAERLRREGFPNSKAENWKGSRVPELIANVQAAPTSKLTLEDIEPFLLEQCEQLIVLVDGRFSEELSRLELPHKVHVAPLGKAIAEGSAVLREHLDSTANGDSFADWNTAGFVDGVFITTAEETVFAAPIQILHVRTSQPGTVCFPRVLIHLRDKSELSIIEHHVGLEDASTSTVAVTELVAHAGAKLWHDRIQQEWRSACHVHSVRVRVDEGAQIRQGNAVLGAGHARLTVDAILAGEGSSVAMPGLFVAGGKRRTDIWTRVVHKVPQTTSNERIKGVLGDDAKGHFTGEVVVRPDAQKSVATQENRNLLLSRHALMESKPQLQIEADDVQCSHGSTIGRLDKEALFFLRSRGIGEEDAKIMLTKAFLGEAIEAMHPAIHSYLNDQVEQWFGRHPQTLEVLVPA